MSGSMNLITAQISFLEPRLALIHIPIEYYSFFQQPILRLLFGDDHDDDAAKIPWTNRHDFLNVSITPVECSVICTRELADRFFRPLADLFGKLTGNGKKGGMGVGVEFSAEDYIVIQVEGQGLDAGQRVLELTAPLAMAGISIFFLTTYFSDYILVPHRARRTVTTALEQRGFVFSQSADAFVSQLSPSSPTIAHHHKRQQSSSDSTTPPPITPPAKDVPELQTRTFAKLKRHGIVPTVDRGLRLLSCAGSKEVDAGWDERLKADLLQVLLATCPAAKSSSPTPPESTGLGIAAPEETEDGPSPPDFSTRILSLTLTAAEPISVLLESALLATLGASLLGAKDDEDTLVPITLDLRALPMESTGIVCGVAGRLADGDRDRYREFGAEGDDKDGGGIEISFLSTARAGTVIVKASELERAVGALRGVMEVG